MALSKKALTFLEEYLITPSPTGFESAGQRVWLAETAGFADKTESDVYGSAVAFVGTDPKKPTVMLEAHADEIGFIVRYISEKGFVYLTRLGGSDPTLASAKHVNIHTESGVVSGVFGHTAIHLQDKTENKRPDWKDLFVDIGVNSREEALELVQVGDPATFASDVEFLNENLITARGLDNRIGGFVIAQALKNFSKIKDELAVNVLAVNSVQEEVGGFGARMMAYTLHPDLALVTDVTHATDTPGIDQREHGEIKLGSGPSITHGGANQVNVVRHLKTVAKKSDIAIQHESTSVRTGTDTDSIFFQKAGIPSALISLPLRYMHTPVETVHLSDVEALIALMTEAVKALNGKEDWSPVRK